MRIYFNWNELTLKIKPDVFQGYTAILADQA
jgi:hypothetical protein